MNSVPIVILGSGYTGQEVARALKSEGANVMAFIDDTANRWYTKCYDLPVFPVSYLNATKVKPLVVIAIANSLHIVDATVFRLMREGHNAVSFLQLPHLFPAIKLRFQTHPQVLCSNFDNINRLKHLLADQKSIQVLTEQVQFRLTNNTSYLSPPDNNIYFPDDVDLKFKDNTCFVDVGAYNGDTATGVHKNMVQCTSIVALEPDPHNFDQLNKILQSLPIKVTTYQFAVADQDTVMGFSANGDMASCLSNTADSYQVQVKSLNTVVTTLCPPQPLYIKFDIEGSEQRALNSALSWIRIHKPKMAISIYHLSDDLWKIPLMIADLDVGYKVSIRSHGYEGTEVVCYCY